jgi:hypothetical protein
MTKTRRTAAQWQTLIEQFPKSDLTVKAYCQQQQVSLFCFYQWRSKLENNHPANVTVTTDWVEVPNKPPTQPLWDIELSLPNGVTLRMNNV